MDLLTAIGLMAIIGAIAMPAVSELSKHYQLRATADQLAFEISRARMRSVGQGVFSRVRILPHGYVVETSDDGSTFEVVGGPFDLPSGLSLGTETTGVTFGRTGLAPAPVTIALGQNNAQTVLHVNILGRVDSL